jgi:hypothetical protein
MDKLKKKKINSKIMEYKGEKFRIIPYGEKDQKRLLKIVSENSQVFLVSDVLLNALTNKFTEIDEFHRVWMIECDCCPGITMGIIILQKIDKEHQTAEMVMIFGESENYKDSRFFREIFNVISKYVFEELDLNRLQVEVLENDLKLKKAYKRVGFVEEGLLRNKYKIKNKCDDAYVMSILKIEWERSKS